MAIEGVVFDLGHTLMHLSSTWPQVFDQGVRDLSAFLAQHLPEIDAAAFCRSWLERRQVSFAEAAATLREVTAVESMRWTLAQAGITDPSPALIDGAIDAFFAYEDACWQVDPDSHAVLQELKGHGLRLGLFSNATHDPFIQSVVDRLGLRPWLSPVLSSAGVGIRKPDPAALAPFAEAWDLPARSIVMVGDTLDVDILGAQRAGMRGVWYRSAGSSRQEGPGTADAGAPDRISPDVTIERLSELPGCLEQL